MLQPGGAVMGFFCTSGVERADLHEVRDRRRRRTCAIARTPAPAAPAARLQNRDIIRMFEGLTVSDSFLLKSNIREMLLRRP